jgi:hypothetical protein
MFLQRDKDQIDEDFRKEDNIVIVTDQSSESVNIEMIEMTQGCRRFPYLVLFRCLILFLTKPPNCFCLHSIERFPAIYFSIPEVNIRFIYTKTIRWFSEK